MSLAGRIDQLVNLVPFTGVTSVTIRFLPLGPHLIFLSAALFSLLLPLTSPYSSFTSSFPTLLLFSRCILFPTASHLNPPRSSVCTSYSRWISMSFVLHFSNLTCCTKMPEVGNPGGTPHPSHLSTPATFTMISTIVSYGP